MHATTITSDEDDDNNHNKKRNTVLDFVYKDRVYVVFFQLLIVLLSSFHSKAVSALKVKAQPYKVLLLIIIRVQTFTDMFPLYSARQLFLIMGLGQTRVNVISQTENNNYKSYFPAFCDFLAHVSLQLI